MGLFGGVVLRCGMILQPERVSVFALCLLWRGASLLRGHGGKMAALIVATWVPSG